VKNPLTMAVLCLFAVTTLPAQNARISGQISSWLGARFSDLDQPLTGLRYLPECLLEHPLGENLLDLNASANASLSRWHDGSAWQNESQIKAYRAWLRFSNAQNELRIGLQKINFGSAALIRPLMWFDRIDPRDPLQLTDGVWGLLFRRYFVNNANFWLWALYGNDTAKGWEVLPPVKTTPEWGGRLQLPVPRGELAATYHYRRANLDKGVPAIKALLGLPASVEIDFGPLGQADERRFGLDGKFDLTVGLWFETAFTHRDITQLPAPWQRITVIGADYTFGLGNGLHAMVEHARMETSETALAKSADLHDFTALSLHYPLGLLDSVTGLLYRNWESQAWYRFLRWQRSYDNIQLHLMLYWNPERLTMLPQMESASAMAGRGFQLLFVFNH